MERWMDAMVGLMEGKQFITGGYSVKISIESVLFELERYSPVKWKCRL